MLRRRRYWIAAAAAVAAAVLGWHVVSGRGQGLRFEAAAPTPEVGEAAKLRAAARGASLVICSLDAARADHFGCYGYERETTPSIDRLAEESVVFRQHFTQHVTTKPSVSSLMTGQYPDTHLAYGNRKLAEGTFTLARGLEAAGFRTVLFSSNPNASPGTGLGLDFQESYDQTDVEPLVGGWEELTKPEPLLALIESWLKKNGRKRFFAYVHLDPPHQPYLQPGWMTKLFQGKQPIGFKEGEFAFPVEDRKMLATCLHPPLPEWINLYDANLRYGDWAVGELEKALREAGVFEKTVFIVTADHGEAFGEHGYLWHERGVYDELTHVPLVMRLPGGARAVEEAEALTQTVDLLPTVCDLLGVRYPREAVQGRSFLPVMAGLEDRVHEHVFSRSDGKPPSYLVRSGEWALMLWGNGKWRALYDLRADPGQRRNVIAERPEAAAEMVEAFREFAMGQRRPPVDFLRPGAKLPPLPEDEEVEMTPELRRQLRALGYVR